MLGGVADFLDPVSKFLSRFKLPESIPLLGGSDAADLTGVKGSQGLLDDMSYGKSPIQGASLQTTKVDPRLIDLAGLTSAVVPSAMSLGKTALREGARQIQTGTGLLGRNTLNPRMSIFAGEGAKTAKATPKTQYELAHEVAQRNAAKPVSEGGLGLPADNMALDRAKAMGFDTPAYHGTDADIPEFDPATIGKIFNADEHGFYSTSKVGSRVHINPLSKKEKVIPGYATADNYAKEAAAANNTNSETIYPLLLRGDNSRTYDFRTNNPEHLDYGTPSMAYIDGSKKSIINEALKNKNGLLKILADNDSTYVNFNNSDIRSRFAAFDPFKRNSADILAGVGAGGMLDPQAIAEALRQREKK